MTSRLLLVQHSAGRDGSAFSGLLLADGLREAGWEVHVVFGHRGPMEAVYAEHGHTTHVAPHKNWLRRDHLLRFLKDVLVEYQGARALQRIVKELRPDVVYVNSVVSLAGVLAARRAGVPVVWHLRELFADVGGEMHAPEVLKPLVRRMIVRLVDRLAAPSRAIAENLLGSWAECVTVVPNAADACFFEETRTPAEARRSLDLPDTGPIIGVPGTLRPVKGHAFFFDAVPPLVEAFPSLCLAVTGDGSEAYVHEIKARAQALGLFDRTRFLGSVTDMPAFYRACDVVCVSSRSESFGRTVIEAMAVGTPVVATAVGGIREIVRDGETGLLVSYGDHSALTEAIHRMLMRPELREKVARAAREEAGKRFLERTYRQRLLEMVKSLAKES
ncbi:glycosyltransferase family 4 protein [Rhodocaloribacter sp.]